MRRPFKSRSAPAGRSENRPTQSNQRTEQIKQFYDDACPAELAHGAEDPLKGTVYKHYVLSVLTLVYTMNYLDRGLIILLLQPIKEDLDLSDTQLGFLTGIAFGLFYAVLGLPVARWADRGNRVTITSVAIGLWGLTVMCSIFVSNFIHLVCARIAAAVGEAGCMPPTYSLLGDYFPEASARSSAMTVYCLAAPCATLGSFLVGGWLNEQIGWRYTFFLMGVPALFVALVVRLTVAEPRVHRSVAVAAKHPSLGDVLRTLWIRRSSRNLCTAIILLFTMGLGLGPWYAAFMMRSHGMSTSELGLWLGAIFGLGGIVGILSGGYAATRYFSNDERRQLQMSAVAVACLLPCFLLFLLLPGKHLALMSLIPLVIAFNVFFGPAFALMQRLVPDDMRATSLAAVMLLANLIGMGIGPQVVGILSDILAPAAGAESLRYAMLAMSFVALWVAYHFWRAAQTVRDDLAARVPSTGSY